MAQWFNGSLAGWLKDIFRLLLAQLSAISPALRVASLKALQALPHWDAEVFNRAVRIPPFEKMGDAPLPDFDGLGNTEQDERAVEQQAVDEGVSRDQRKGQAAAKRPQPAECWYGALYFVLDDEDPAVRATALSVLGHAVCRGWSEPGEQKLLEGMFQRLAMVSSLCIHDDDKQVRSAAADVLINIMASHSVALAAGSKPVKSGGDPQLASLMQAFRRDPATVLRVLRQARFVDSQTLEAAILWLLDVDAAEHGKDPKWEAQLREATAHLGTLHKAFFEPRAKGERAHGLQPQSLGLKLVSKVCPKQKAATLDVTIADSRGSSSTVDLLDNLIGAVAGGDSVAGYDLRGPNALPICEPNFCKPLAAGISETLICWLEDLQACYEQLCDAVNANRVLPQKVAHGIVQLRRALTRVCSPDAGPLAGNLAAAAAWTDLFLSVFKAVVQDFDQKDVDSKLLGTETARGQAVRVHICTSWLMHGFQWPAPAGPQQLEPALGRTDSGCFPQVLLAFRLLSLRLLAGAKGAEEDLRAAAACLGARPEESARLLTKPLGLFLPDLPASFFRELLGPDKAVVAHVASLSFPGENMPSYHFSTALRSALVEVDVETTFTHGLVMKVSGPCRHGSVTVPVPPVSLALSRVESEYRHGESKESGNSAAKGHDLTVGKHSVKSVSGSCLPPSCSKKRQRIRCNLPPSLLAWPMMEADVHLTLQLFLQVDGAAATASEATPSCSSYSSSCKEPPEKRRRAAAASDQCSEDRLGRLNATGESTILATVLHGATGVTRERLEYPVLSEIPVSRQQGVLFTVSRPHESPSITSRSGACASGQNYGLGHEKDAVCGLASLRFCHKQSHKCEA
ncbi:unnamed protein product [Polarella glacialis]|uniref:HEAT repeat-containing protein n=1 Tax=Polarella glacialis TaxID=89957 RepID=A0A813JF04_POLGL|nr:unnamed protein product [Polarella glacialis]